MEILKAQNLRNGRYFRLGVLKMNIQKLYDSSCHKEFTISYVFKYFLSSNSNKDWSKIYGNQLGFQIT